MQCKCPANQTTTFDLLQYDFQNKIIRFSNGYILQDEKLVKEDLWISNGKILDGLHLFFKQQLTADICIDVQGSVISPGFIDIQVNGGFGLDFSNPSVDTVQVCYEVARNLPRTGVTSFCPTIITSSKQAYAKIIPRFHGYSDGPDCARMLGLHMEGPFISKQCPGMHPIDNILEFGPDPVKILSDTYGRNMYLIRIVTLAPELTGSNQAITELVSKGITVSIGHTNTHSKDLEQAVVSGATFMTHLFNAMPKFHHRQSHLFGSIAKSMPVLFVGIIADLVHVHPAALRVAEAIAPGRVVLVTDANTAFGLPDGMYTFGERKIEVKNSMAYVAGTDCLAGGTTPLPVCIRNFWLEVYQHNPRCTEKPCEKWCGLGQAIAAASTRPATGLKLFQKSEPGAIPKLAKGSLQPGADADLVMLCPTALSHPTDPTLKILSTWINGKPVYTAADVPFLVTLRDSRH
ncbi:N-acetylglucosamine-6-phosphate deacetylase [Paragonimus heterotremus]|uniref:N-acetylglucosamine-6-phosphate deacetylase n=1 Tax=Paragonimus heterotremus TaxID=100268 RepID=A0A8J4WHH5_9TREM|nr:N-acetylglucosamine-6-phosphate deacetylase [Paragonimus heterotremus]